MLIGVPKEIKNHEYRAGLTTSSVRELVNHGHEVIVQTQTGIGIGLSDEDYQAAGAQIVNSPEVIFDSCEMIVKVKEPQPNECNMLSKGQILFTYLHLAPDEIQTRLLIESGVTAIAYETVTGPNNSLPLLAPMSEVAGRLAIQAGAHALEKAQGGNGTLLGGVTGVAPARVLVIGGGVVGTNAAQIAAGMGAQVTILDRSITRLAQLNNELEGRVTCLYSTNQVIEQHALKADMVVGAVLLPGAAAPKLINRDLISRMRPGSVVVDVAIDQGGCFETSKATTHQLPTYVVDEVVHYCVANMPGAVPRTSTFALNNATLPFTIALANKGYKQALLDDANLMQGLNVHEGKVTYKAVADAWGYDYVSAKDAIS